MTTDVDGAPRLEQSVSAFDESRCLQCDPFEGDFGAPGDKCLKDRMGTARKPGPCSLCGQEIQPGERVRIAAHIFDGQLHSYRWCASCCAAMAASWEDDGRAYEARAHLRTYRGTK